MKRLILALLTMVLAAYPASASAQCAKCVPDQSGGHCQWGPLQPPAFADCVDIITGGCWEATQSCPDRFALNAVKFDMVGAWIAPVVHTEAIARGISALRSCHGAIVALAYSSHAELTARKQTRHLIV